MNEPHAYVYIHDRNTPAGKGLKKVVETACLKEFDFEKYNKDPQFYHNKLLKMKDQGKAVSVNVLYAAESKELVDSFVANNKKRFHIPKNLNLTDDIIESNDTTVENSEGEPIENAEEEITKAKKKRKKNKQDKNDTSKKQRTVIIENYINEADDVEESELNSGLSLQNVVDQMNQNENSVEIRRPALRNVGNVIIPSYSAATSSVSIDASHALNAYKIQAEYYKEKYEESMKQFRSTKNNFGEDGINELYKNIFEVSGSVQYVSSSEQAQTINEAEESLVVLNKGVKCNALAYKDAFKEDKCQTFFSKINRGIYGLDDLATRCVRDQANSNHRPLSPIKREVVEDQFFKYLDLKGYTIPQKEKEMQKCSKYQHNSITAARKVLKRLQRNSEENCGE